MLIHVVKLVAVAASALLLSQGWRGDVKDIELEEFQAPLFDNDMFTNRYAVVGKQGKSLDIESTLNDWSEGRKSPVETNSKGELRSWMLTFQTTPVLSADNQSGGGAGSNCSIGSSDVEACSIANVGEQGAGTDCSTADGGPGTGTGTPTCSVFVEGPTNTNNTGCSAYGSGGAGNVGCSAGGSTETEACSTSGGDSSGAGEGDGAAVCSAALTSGNQCSAFGSEEVTCSTNTGEQQACSAGVVTPGETVSCSTDGGPDGSASGSGTFCSVGDASPVAGGDRPNICSAISHGNPQTGGSSDCSTLEASGGGGQCSVQAATDGSTAGGACTAIGQNGAAAPGSFECSTKPNSPGGPDTTGTQTCSVINANGTVTGPTGTPPRCGTAVLSVGGAVDPLFGLFSALIVGAAELCQRRRRRIRE